jgi:hypothetical protein
MLSEEDILDDFNVHIKRDKKIKSLLVPRKRIIRFLEKRKDVVIYEWDYVFKRWLRNVDHFHDMNVTGWQLEEHGKKFARYEIFHPEFGVIKVYKHISMFDDENSATYVTSVPKKTNFPEGLE